MKAKIVKLSLLTFLFLLFVVGWIFQIIDFIALIITRSSSYAGWAYDINVKIPTIAYYLFGSVLLFTTITAYLGYKVIKSSISLFKEYRK